MALNRFMHPRNRYRNMKLDYAQLAEQYPQLKDYVQLTKTGRAKIDFQNGDALRQLTLVLLQKDFSLSVDLPSDRLVPTLPMRLNYIHWIEDIIGTQPDLSGIDIGTGACCIFSLLASVMHGWNFVATESDDVNFLYAQRNVEKNNLKSKVTVLKVTEDKILADMILEDKTFDFCMCNPPFFDNILEAQGITSTRSEARSPPNSSCTAQPQEVIFPGGEVGFISRLILDSLKLRHRIRVYTSMIGKKDNIPAIKAELEKHGIHNFKTTEFCQGHTMRWGIGWSFDESVKFPKSTFQTMKLQEKSVLPFVFTVPHDLGGVQYSVSELLKFITSLLEELNIMYRKKKSSENEAVLILGALQNTWINQRRKRREKQLADKISSKIPCLSDTPAMGQQEYSSEAKDSVTASVSSSVSGCNVKLPFQAASVLPWITSDHSVSDQVTCQDGAPETTGSLLTSRDDPSQSSKDGNQMVLRQSAEVDSKMLYLNNAKQNFDKLLDWSSEDEMHDVHSDQTPHGSENTGDLIVKCKLSLKRLGDDIILKMEARYYQQRDLVHQLLTFFKNKIISQAGHRPFT